MSTSQKHRDAEISKPAINIRKKCFRALAFITFAGVTYLTPLTNVATKSTSGLWFTPPQNTTDRPAYMPDSNLTPGDTLAVTKADICAAGYGVGIHDLPTSYKNKVFASYGLTLEPTYVVDRLISIDLGGANTIKNLWPQPKDGPWNSQIKDKLEHELRRRVCNGSLDLQAAQHEIAKDWVAAYTKYLGAKEKVNQSQRRRPPL